MNCGTNWIIILLVAAGATISSNAALCDPKGGENFKVFHIPENSVNDTYIGNLGVEGIAEVGSTQTINLGFDSSYLETVNECGKTCHNWLRLDPSSQDIRLFLNDGEVLDRDGSNGVKRLDVKISCEVTSSPGTTEAVYIRIFVDDVNDNTPRFVTENMMVSLNELTPAQNRVFTVIATDEDEISNITYKISSSNKPEHFVISDIYTGDVTLKKTLDYDSISPEDRKIWVVIEAIDNSNGRTRTAVTNVTVNLKDGDDQLPLFQPCFKVGSDCVNAEYHARISRYSAIGIKISDLTPGPIVAVDLDTDLQPRAIISYSLNSDPQSDTDATNYFVINKTNGVVTLKSLLPTTISSISAYIKATQGNDPSKYTITKLTLSIVDVIQDNYPPKFEHGDLNGYVDPKEGAIAIVRNEDGSPLHIVASDQDNANFDKQPLNFRLLAENSLFQVTIKGYLIYTPILSEASSTQFTLHIQAINTEAKSDLTRKSEEIRIFIDRTANANACQNMGCTTATDQSMIAGLSVVTALLLAAIIVIIILVVMLRKLRTKEIGKKSLEGFQNHFDHKMRNVVDSKHSSASSGIDKYNGTIVATHTSQLSAPINVTSALPERHHSHTSHSGKGKYYENIQRNGAKITNDEDSPSIAPFDSFDGADDQTAAANYGWKKYAVMPTVNYHQLSVDYEIFRSQHKHVHRGFLTLQNGHISKCIVKVYADSYPYKRNLCGDLTSMHEVLNVRSCTQINLVKFFGSCIYLDSMYAVYELVTASTDLKTALRNSRMKDHSSVISSFTGSQLSNFALSIADGLRYLHDHGVVHGNVCSGHILLTEQLSPKLKGCCGRNNFRLRKHKNIRWAAPEVVRSKEYNFSSDVWSYAIVVWEIATLGGMPYPSVGDKSIKNHIQSLKDGDIPLSSCRNVVRPLWSILESCWEINPHDRPTISEVYKKSSKLRESTTPIFVSSSPGYEYAPTTTIQILRS